MSERCIGIFMDISSPDFWGNNFIEEYKKVDLNVWEITKGYEDWMGGEVHREDFIKLKEYKG